MPIASRTDQQHYFPVMALLPRGISLLPVGRLIALNHFSHGRGSAVFCVTLILNMDLSALPTMLLSKLPVDA